MFVNLYRDMTSSNFDFRFKSIQNFICNTFRFNNKTMIVFGNNK